ncbi:MAG: potassium-transporting ATPase subunit KdpA [Candidatus Hydrogenedentes bacterium]|nr:potassium-transporting ATPase subunit KdpA [Candidatus Hydrogenedentota bacterium]
MSNGYFILLAAFMLTLFGATFPFGAWLVRIERGLPGAGLLGRLERAVYRLCGIDPAEGMSWSRYAMAVLVFNFLGVLAVYALQRTQAWLPLNPQGFGNVTADSAFNTAVSFVSNTNWQGYGGESTMSYLTQMAGLAVQNFLSAATGIAVAFAMIRGFTLKRSASIGNFFVDVYRITVYMLLPLSAICALVLVSQGMVQNFSAYVTVAPLDSAAQPAQELAMGPAASQVAIKMLGTNGGGFFNANASHPFENPNALSNFLQMALIFLIPAGLCRAFGHLAGDYRQGWVLWGVMAALFLSCAVGVGYFEQQANPALSPVGLDMAASPDQPGGNMEGKEARFGISATSLFATITTSASCGAVNGMHDSFSPLGGLFPMWLMQLGEVVFGGVGSGLYGMLVFAVIAVFMAGLMIGRTPEYLGKKLEPFEMKMAAMAVLVTPVLVLAGTAVAISVEVGRSGMLNPGAHGFSEILYAFSSAANNNGSAFGGLSANTPFYNSMLGIAMWLGRFAVIVPVLALAGGLAAKAETARTVGTLPTDGVLFAVMLGGTVLATGALTYIPALALGPVAEHLLPLALH